MMPETPLLPSAQSKSSSVDGYHVRSFTADLFMLTLRDSTDLVSDASPIANVPLHTDPEDAHLAVGRALSALHTDCGAAGDHGRVQHQFDALINTDASPRRS